MAPLCLVDFKCLWLLLFMHSFPHCAKSISLFSCIFVYLSKMLRVSFSPNTRHVSTPKDIQYPRAGTSIESIAIVTPPAQFHDVELRVSQSFPPPELGSGGHLS